MTARSTPITTVSRATQSSSRTTIHARPQPEFASLLGAQLKVRALKYTPHDAYAGCPARGGVHHQPQGRARARQTATRGSADQSRGGLVASRACRWRQGRCCMSGRSAREAGAPQIDRFIGKKRSLKAWDVTMRPFSRARTIWSSPEPENEICHRPRR